MRIPQLRQWRELRGLTQRELATKSGVSVRSIAGYEAGAGVRPNTARKLAEALDIKVADFFAEPEVPKVTAPPSQQLTLNHELAEERRANWRSAVDDARRLREGTRARLEDLLKAWQASRERGELRSARRGYRDEIQELFNRAYGAPYTLASILFAEGGIPEPDDWEEVTAADRFYRALIEMMRREGFVIEERQAGPPKVEEPAA